MIRFVVRESKRTLLRIQFVVPSTDAIRLEKLFHYIVVPTARVCIIHTKRITHATPYRNNFTVFTLNAQSLNSKFSEIQSLISELSKDNLLFDAICFQETWLHTNDDVGIFHLPAYNIIHKGKICCGHGGLVIYLNNRYTQPYITQRSV